MNNSQKQFISSIVRAIGDKCNKAKILNSVVIAQAILETGWGTSELYKKYNNAFGLNNYFDEVSKQYDFVKISVPQEVNGKIVYNAEYMAKHKSVAESVEHLMRWYTIREKYKPIIGNTDYKKVCNFLTGRYATDSQYGKKLIILIENYGLAAYDKPKAVTPKKEVKIQVGLYVNLDYALEFCKTLINKDFNPYIRKNKDKHNYTIFVITDNEVETKQRLSYNRITYI